MLSETRRQIDQIDREIVTLIEKRQAVVQQVAVIKEKNDLPIFDNKREGELLCKVRSYCESEKTAEVVEKVFRYLMAASKEEQNRYLSVNDSLCDK